MAIRAKMGANPYTLSDIENAANIVQVADEMLSYLARCERCKLQVSHLVPQVSSIRDTMAAIVQEFGHDAAP